MSEKIVIDVWGQIRGESEKYRVKPPDHDLDDVPADGGDGSYYFRFFRETPCAIHRDTVLTANGRMTVQRDVAYGVWDDRSTLTYQPRNNNEIEVDRQEIAISGQTFSGTVGAAISGSTIACTMTYPNRAEATFTVIDGELPDGVLVSSGGTITGTPDCDAGSYHVTVRVSAPLAKSKDAVITLTIAAAAV